MFTKDTLSRAADGLLRMQNNNLNSVDSLRVEICREFIELIEDDAFLEKTCPFNYFYIGKEFNELLEGRYRDYFERFYLYCIRFLREYLLYLRRAGERDVFSEDLWSKFIDEDPSLFKDVSIYSVEYIKNKMDIDILNFYLGGKTFNAFLKYEELSKDVEDRNSRFNIEQQEKIDSFVQLLSSKENTVNRLASQLKEQEKAFNFVGLNQGFSNILSKKETSKKITFGTLFFLSVILAFIPLAYILGRLFNVFDLQEALSSIGWEQMLPVAGLEFILIYIFRVVLSHYSSLETQIMQLELRQSLCQFIQSYVDYAKNIKKDDKEVLDKFENLIFSSILSNSDKVPSTFDGVEQLTNLFEKIKK